MRGENQPGTQINEASGMTGNQRKGLGWEWTGWAGCDGATRAAVGETETGVSAYPCVHVRVECMNFCVHSCSVPWVRHRLTGLVRQPALSQGCALASSRRPWLRHRHGVLPVAPPQAGAHMHDDAT
jgi:hypothetical protein